MPKKRKKEVNLLELIPVRNREWDTGGDASSRVDIIVPRFAGKWLGKLILPKLKRPHYRVSLDEIGSWVWRRCDGTTTVKQIGRGLSEQFGDEVEPVYDRLALFFRQMEEHSFIVFSNLSSESAGEDAHRFSSGNRGG